MFAWWGRTVYRFRYIVIGIMVALCLGGGVYGISLGEHVTQSGFYDDGSQSVAASIAADKAYGRDRTSHVVAILTPPDGKKVDDPDWMKKTTAELDKLVADHPDQIEAWVGWLKAPDTTLATVQQMKTEDLSKTFVSIPLKGDDDDSILKNYQVVEPDLQKINGGNIQLAGLQSPGQRADRHHRRGPAARRGGRHPAGVRRAVLRVRRCDRGGPARASSAA